MEVVGAARRLVWAGCVTLRWGEEEARWPGCGGEVGDASDDGGVRLGAEAVESERCWRSGGQDVEQAGVCGVV
jgi:hypothetical protein